MAEFEQDFYPEFGRPREVHQPGRDGRRRGADPARRVRVAYGKTPPASGAGTREEATCSTAFPYDEWGPEVADFWTFGGANSTGTYIMTVLGSS